MCRCASGWWAQSGAHLPLTLEGENAAGPETRVLELTEPFQRFVFVDVEEEPLLSLGRGFSAPAIFTHRRTDRPRPRHPDGQGQRRLQPLGSGPDPGQRKSCWKWRAAARADADTIYIAAMGDVLAEAEDDPAFAAQMLMPPTENELAAQRSAGGPRRHSCRPRRPGARHRRGAWPAPGARSTNRCATTGDFSPDAKSAGRRALRNAALRYLTAADDEAAAGLADAHYRSATNMTDMIAGLAALTRMESPLRDAAFTHFHDRFRSDPLVLDKWMSLQAGSPLPERRGAVRALMTRSRLRHQESQPGARPDRRLQRPIICASMTRDGAGYRLVGEVIRTLDPMNPQVAARLAGAFESWRRYDPARQA